VTSPPIPPDLLVTGPDKTRTATEVLALPSTLQGFYDGYVPIGGPGAPGVPANAFVFWLGWNTGIAARSYEDLCQMAAVLGAHLAGLNAQWPSGEAHVRALPVVDTRFEYVVTPQLLPIVEHKRNGTARVYEDIGHALPEDGPVRQQILAMAAQARACESGQCDCAGDA
jgi:hypothetical protein